MELSEVRKASDELAAFKEKKELQLYSDDVTTEKLISILADNDGKAAIFSTEGGIFDMLKGIYTKYVNIDVFLKGYSGDAIRVERIGRKSENILNPTLSLMLMAQPSVLAGIMVNETFRGRGLTARFLYCMPKSNVGNRKYRSGTLTPEVYQNYERLIQNLLADKPTNAPEVITLSADADKLLEQFAEELEPKLKTEYLDSIKITQTELLLYKELLLYAGEGKFPLIENSLASSYLATEVYLDEIDCRLEQYFSKLNDIHRVKFVRYVDDLYILISTDMDEVEMHKIYNSVRNEYSSILKDFNLSLNTKKCCWKPTYKINDELKKSLYDEFFNGEKHSIETRFQGKFLEFLEDIELELFLDCVDVEKYNHYLEKHFSSNDVEFTASEVFNYYIYESDNELKLPEIVLKIREIIEQDISFISLDPKRLTVMVMKTHDAKTIKAMLSKLFSRGREGLWNSYDTSIAISYLIQRQFKHKDLLAALETNCLDIYKFYAENCKYDFCEIFKDEEIQNYIKIIKNDWKTYYLYFMYKVELEKHNNMSAYAYFKNYFDRMSAHLAFVTKYEKDLKRPNYKNYYQEGNLKRLYKGIEDSENVISASHKLRNSNPISHSSAGLIDDNSSSSKLLDSIKGLNKLIKGFCDIHKNEIESL